MNPTLFQIGVAVVLVAVNVAGIMWFLRHLRASSERRLNRMLKHAGVDNDIISQGDTEAIINDIRSRCQKCRSEALCDRWLDGDEEGENSFCPNAPVFSSLTGSTPTAV
jgi:hypothetical protein